VTGERGNNSRGAWSAALAGVACGALGTALNFVYCQVTDPSPYDILILFYSPVSMTFGGMAGLLVWAMRDSGRPSGGRHQPRADAAPRGIMSGRVSLVRKESRASGGGPSSARPAAPWLRSCGGSGWS
jgi:hypothetical protein